MKAPREPREEGQGVDLFCGRMLGLLHRGGAVRDRDHFLRTKNWELWVLPGKRGVVFFRFRSWGVARKWSRKRTAGGGGSFVRLVLL